MSLAALASGADCGPSNPLQQLNKWQARDRSLQQDRFNPVASSSKAVFRSQRNVAAEADAARFFDSRQGSSFDLSPLNRALPPGVHQQQPPQWANDFAAAQMGPSLVEEDQLAFSTAFQGQNVPGWAADFAASSASTRSASPRIAAPAPARHYSPMSHQPRYVPSPMSQMDVAAHAHLAMAEQGRQMEWEHAFMAQQAQQHLLQQQQSFPQEAEALYQAHQHNASTNDDLARTAGELLESVAHEQSDKFANSSFMELMRKLRDHEVQVEGNKVVEQLTPVESVPVLDKGKGRAFEPMDGPVRTMPRTTPLERRPGESLSQFAERQLAQNTVDGYAEMQDIWDDEYRSREVREARGRRVQFQGDGGALRSEEDLQEALDKYKSTSWEEDFDAADIVGGPPAVRFRPPSPKHAPSAQEMEWDKLQADWDEFEATNVGISRTDAAPATRSGYVFRPHNPYLQDASARAALNRQHQLHQRSAPLDSVLLKEADAQLNPGDPMAWYDLGVKQQENEREDMAIHALQTAVSIAPNMHDAWLALAVSFTNENDRTRAYDAIEMWAGCRYEYADAVNEFRNRTAGQTRTLSERHADLTEMLINMARMSSTEDLDADVQIALGVLFNTSEEYDKAGDCFAAAMSVRPDDPLLFNRLGATLANSGRGDEAVRFYFKALELQPTYARARYNLAISCINMGSYQEAAEHILGALALQEQDAQLAKSLDGPMDAPAAGSLTSSTLWDTLHMICTMLGRSDLLEGCEKQDLELFRDGSFTF